MLQKVNQITKKKKKRCKVLTVGSFNCSKVLEDIHLRYEGTTFLFHCILILTLLGCSCFSSGGCKYYANLYLTEGILTEGIYVPFYFMYHVNANLGVGWGR